LKSYESIGFFPVLSSLNLDSIATLSVSGILNIRLLLPFGNGSGILLSMSDKETQSSSG
jgi:hypothetical protein